MSHSQAFSWKSNAKDARAYFKPSEGISCLCALLASIRKAQVQPTVSESVSSIAIY